MVLSSTVPYIVAEENTANRNQGRLTERLLAVLSDIMSFNKQVTAVFKGNDHFSLSRYVILKYKETTSLIGLHIKAVNSSRQKPFFAMSPV